MADLSKANAARLNAALDKQYRFSHGVDTFRREVEWQAAHWRGDWENNRAEEQDAEDSAVAEAMQAARPDLAPCYA